MPPGHTRSYPEKQQIDAIFFTALNLADEVQQRAFLDRACAGDSALRTAVERLLSEHAASEDFFAESSASLRLSGEDFRDAVRESVIAECAAVDEKIGSRIGRYKLVERIGEGGWGVVYLAEQETPIRRRVALKIVKLGLDSKRVIARFQSECQALALMDHPGIARVLDAGSTEAGRPYFVMELVNGLRITEFCSQNRLNLRERLSLFGQVCQAVQHAHQRGIIHRDIKPSNILVSLVDGAPTPKIIDFGIAKAIEARFTEPASLAAREPVTGTPAYMSPEQAGSDAMNVDTRSDIYSLGVLLYELLTGRTPLVGGLGAEADLEAIQNAFREYRPQPPSRRVSALAQPEAEAVASERRLSAPRLVRDLKGDLDRVAMKALEKEPDARYETANGLAADVQHYLNDEPITARRASGFYRFQKLVRRNKILFGAGGVLGVGLLAGLFVTVWLMALRREVHRELARLYLPRIHMADRDHPFFAGGRVTLSAAVEGLPPLSCQWYAVDSSGTQFTPLNNGGKVSGATNSLLALAEATPRNATNYALVVTSLFAAATGEVISVTIQAPPSALTLAYGAAHGGLLMKTGADWNSTGYWQDGTADGGLPASPLARLLPDVPFVVPAGSLVRTPEGALTSTFPGNELILEGDGRFNPNVGNVTNTFSILACKQGSSATRAGEILFTNLIINGGEVDVGVNGIAVLNGAIRIGPANAFFYEDYTGMADRGFQINSVISGSGSIELHLYAGLKTFQPAFTNALEIAGTENPFDGTWKVTQGVLLGSGSNSLGTNSIFVGTQGALETLYDVESPQATLVLDGRLFLHQHDTFGRVIVGGVPLAAGSYTAAELSTAYAANFPVRWTQKRHSPAHLASGSLTVLQGGGG